MGNPEVPVTLEDQGFRAESFWFSAIYGSGLAILVVSSLNLTLSNLDRSCGSSAEDETWEKGGEEVFDELRGILLTLLRCIEKGPSLCDMGLTGCVLWED